MIYYENKIIYEIMGFTWVSDRYLSLEELVYGFYRGVYYALIP
jgi:hypothetical protein